MHPHLSQRKHEAKQAYERHEHARAYVLYRQLFHDHPNEGRFLAMAAMCQIAMQHPASAKSLAKQAVLLSPKDPTAHQALALATLGWPGWPQGLWAPQAIWWLNDQPKSVRIRARQAMPHAEHALEVNSADPDLHGLQALLALLCGDGELADTACQKGRRLDPDHPLCLMVEARRLADQGQTQAACQRLDHLLDAHPDSGPAHGQLAQWRWALDQPEDATAHAQWACHLGASDPQAFDALLTAGQHAMPKWHRAFAWAQTIHRFRQRWSSLRMAMLASMLAIIAGGVGFALGNWQNEPNWAFWTHIVAWGTVFLLATALMAPIGFACALLAWVPAIAGWVPVQKRIESMLFGLGCLYLLLAVPVLATQAHAHERMPTMVAAVACFVPALSAWCVAAPGHQRQQMSIGMAAMAVCWALAGWAVWFGRFGSWALAPVCFVPPAVVAMCMVRWVLNQATLSAVEASEAAASRADGA